MGKDGTNWIQCNAIPCPIPDRFDHTKFVSDGEMKQIQIETSEISSGDVLFDIFLTFQSIDSSTENESIESSHLNAKEGLEAERKMN